MDLSGINITKTGETLTNNKSDSIISITEIKPIDSVAEGEILKKAPKIDEQKKVVVTNYTRTIKGNFSKPEQSVFSLDEIKSDEAIIKSLTNMANILIKNFLKCENSQDSDLDECNAEAMLGYVYGELASHLPRTTFIDSKRPYNADEHSRLYKKLGSLVLF